MSYLWRAFVWLIVLTVLVCAIGGFGLEDVGPVMRLGAIAFAFFLVVILIRFEMLLRSAERAGAASRSADEES